MSRPMANKEVGVTKIMLVHETALQSWARDAGTVLAACALILPGWWIGSALLSTTGFLLFWLWLFNAAIRESKRRTFSIAEAREEIDRIALPASRGDDD